MTGSGYSFPTALGRILLDADTDATGGVVADESKTSTSEGDKATETIETTPEAVIDPAQFKILMDRFTVLESRHKEASDKLKTYEDRDSAERDASRRAELDKHEKSGDFAKFKAAFDKMISEHKDDQDRNKSELAAERAKARNSVVSMRVMNEFSKYNLVPGWLDKLILLHGGEFEAVEAGDSFEVMSKDSETLPSKVAKIMARPEYKAIILAKGGGGTGVTERGSTATPPDAGAVHGQFPSIGHALLEQEAARRPNAGRNPMLGAGVN